MTNEQVKSLTDADLVRLVAENVMEWKWAMYSPGHRAIMESGTRDDLPSAPSIGAVIKANGNCWQPLTDWNDTMQVDHAIVAMLNYSVREWFQKIVTDNGKRWFFDISQRDILEAALLAIGGE